jgi:lysophospholipase L1-like esterase
MKRLETSMKSGATIRAALLLFLGLRPAAAAAAPETFPFRDGDRVVFLGDSITAQCQFSSTIELYLTTRFPKRSLTVFNAGISSDTAGGGAARFADHVLVEKPTVVLINFGMNDAPLFECKPGQEKGFIKQTEAMLEMAEKAKVRVVLVSPNAMDWRVYRNNPEARQQFFAPLKGLAGKHGAAFADTFSLTRAVLEKIEADGNALRPFGDGAHTSPPGALLMAHAILTALHAPAQVSHVEIDAAAGKATTKACTVAKRKFAIDHACIIPA